MQITKTHSEGIAALTVQGQLDGTTSPQLESELLGLVQAGSPRLVLDLAQVPLVSSAALRVLLSAAKRMKKQGGHIHLCALRPEVKQVFDISGLTAFFGIHADLAAALAAAKDAPAAPPTPAAPEAAPARPIPAVPVASSSPATPGLPETESAKPAPVAPPPIAPPPPVPPEPPPTPVDPPGAKAVPPPPTPPEPDPAATLVFAARPKPSSDPMATVIFSSRHAPAEAQPAATEPPHLAFSEAAAAVEPPPAAPALPPTAETPPPAPVAASPLPAAPGTPSTVVPPTPPAPPPEHAAPPVIPPAAGTPPAATPLPVTPLRRTSPAVVAKAAEMRGDPPPAIPSAAPVQIQRHEPRPPVPATPARPLLPIMAAVFTALAILAGVGICLRLWNTEEPRKPDRPASPSPTATPRGEDTPIVTPSVEPSPTAAPVVIRPSPSPTASPTPAPTAVPTATPTIAPTSPAPTPVPTPVPTPTPASTPVPTPSPASTPTETIISPAGAIDTNRASPENQAVRQAVLQRIDAMPLSQADKARLYMALERARGLGKLVTINFATGRTDIAPNDVVNLDSTVHRPKVQRFLDDPAVVLVVLGFSDTKGSDKANKDISDRRARRVVEALRGSCNVTNLIHSIGMGGQTLAGETLEKNRAVEVWAVLP